MIILENISYEIDGKKIINNISLKIDCTKLNVIVGPNGAGKSTLLKLIMGIIKPTKGRILFNNIDITSLEPYERYNLGLSYCFQTPVRFKGMTVEDIFNIITKDEVKHREVLDIVGICPNYIHRSLDTSLSGGEIKKIELAMALLKPDKVALLDEPEAGIDLWSFDNLVSIFHTMKAVIVSHNKDIINAADVIITLKDGELYDIN